MLFWQLDTVDITSLTYSQYIFTQELSIKTEGDVLIVLAKHETKAEGGQSFVSKQFEQRFSLPSGVKPEKISSSLSKVLFFLLMMGMLGLGFFWGH